MVDNIAGMEDASDFKATMEDFFSSETAVTFGGVFAGVSVGEFLGVLIDQKWSGTLELGANLGSKTGLAILLRHLTKGEPTWDNVGIALGAGLGVSAVADVVSYATGKAVGYEALADYLGGAVRLPGPQRVAPPVEQGAKKEKESSWLFSGRDVPVTTLEEEPLEERSEVV